MKLVVRNLRVRCNFVAARFMDRLITPQIIARRQSRARWPIRRPIEREHPARIMGLERTPLSNTFAPKRTLAGLGQCCRMIGRVACQTVAVPYDDSVSVNRTKLLTVADRKVGASCYVGRVSS